MHAGAAHPAGICVRLLLSIDRRETEQQAHETVKLADKFRERGVVGLDLSGNPTIGQLCTWLPALKAARALGLKITLHAAEVCPPLVIAPLRRSGSCFICIASSMLPEATQTLWYAPISETQTFNWWRNAVLHS